MAHLTRTSNLRFRDLLDLKPGDTVESRLVAVIGYGGDFAVYEPSVSMPPDGPADEIARHGDKVSKQRAVGAFPELASKLVYRE